MAKRIIINICLILISTISLVFFINKKVAQSEFIRHIPQEYSWIVHGLLNVLGYMTLFLPGYLIYKYANYLKIRDNGLCFYLLRICFDEEDVHSNLNSKTLQFPQTSHGEVCSILGHFFGLLITYLSWGILQEKVMTQKYSSLMGDSEVYTDSQFLVFVNRVLAFCVTSLYILYQKQTRNYCPLYKYSYCSFTNIMSSWCQYEALKYVSFPHQVLAKAAKTIPVMIMGRIISNTKYEFYEYVTSIILSIGMLLFMLDVQNEHTDSVITTFSGVLLLLLYVIFDSFTSNWQGALFKTYNTTPSQMMCFVNFFSCVLTSVSLFQQNAFSKSFQFLMKYPQFGLDCLILSICSFCGQVFIFSTIRKFGPLIFAIFTTIRQGISILLSCFIYNHHVNISGVLGIVLVFVSVLIRIYCGYRLTYIRKNTPNLQKISV